jgi:D-glycero-alpha-D-manno-heptose-7-phosphate kinase
LNSLYDELLSLGAIGSKLLGAGAGGYFLSFVMPDKSKEFEIAVKNIGYSIERFNFYPKGAEAWTL